MMRWLAAVLLLALVSRAGARAPIEEERLIGWKGEGYLADDATLEQREDAQDILELVGEPQGRPLGNEGHPSDPTRPWIQTLSWKPRAFVYHNFLSEAEVKHILKLAAPQMKRSTVVGANDTGVVDNIRTSAGTFLMRNQDPVISAVEERLAAWSHLPRSFQEDMQVLRYGPSNKYGAHMDGLERVMSVLIYLVAPEEGGETAFPNANQWLHPEMGEPSQGPFSSCAKGHVAYKPKQGDALMFYDLTVDYLKMDSFSTHTGCPVVTGVKWNAVKWIHGKPFRPEEYETSLKATREALPDPGECRDQHERCKMWADAGECESNPGYMLGGNVGQGMCRFSCKVCESCQPGDDACFNRNREMGGFVNFDLSEFKGLLTASDLPHIVAA